MMAPFLAELEALRCELMDLGDPTAAYYAKRAWTLLWRGRFDDGAAWLRMAVKSKLTRSRGPEHQQPADPRRRIPNSSAILWRRTVR